MTDREFALDVVRRLVQSGYEAYWAGGCVRDELLGLAPADYDVATNARPEEVSKVFKRTIEVGASFGVVEVIGPRRSDGSIPKVQVATFRNDGQYTDGRRPDSVTFSTPEEDAQRRDFTINGMFYDPLTQRVLDFVGGQADLQAKILRAIGDPQARFREDKLRLMRAVRMATRFNFPIEPTTAQAIRQMAADLVVVSAERIADELRKMLVHPARAKAMRGLDELGLMRRIIPEIETTVKAQNLWQHTLETLENLVAPHWPEPMPISVEYAFAALVQHLPVKQVGLICTQLKMSNTEKTRIEWLVGRQTALVDAPTMRPSQLNPLLVQPAIGELLAFHRTLAKVAGQPTTHVEFCESKLQSTPLSVLNPPPLLTGDDLIDAGWKQGPLFKTVLEQVRAKQLDGELQGREEAFAWATRTFKP